MAIFQGTFWSQTFAVKDDAGAAVDLTGMEFEADFRASVDGDEQLNLTSDGGGFVIETPATDGRLTVKILAAQSEVLLLGKVIADVHHANASPGPVPLFRFSNKVKKSVTRT